MEPAKIPKICHCRLLNNNNITLFSRSSLTLCVSTLTSLHRIARKLKVSASLRGHRPITGQTAPSIAVSPSELSGMTGLRVRMTGLGDIPRLPGRSLSRFYAIKEMRMMGSCMCHGHANRCLPDVQNGAAQERVQVGTQRKVLACGSKCAESSSACLFVDVNCCAFNLCFGLAGESSV